VEFRWSPTYCTHTSACAIPNIVHTLVNPIHRAEIWPEKIALHFFGKGNRVAPVVDVLQYLNR